MHLIIFQLVVGPVLAVLCALSVMRAVRGAHRRPALFAAFIWVCALLAVLRPDVTMLIAAFMGIGRGTDLVLYFFVMAFLGAAFYFYNRVMLLEASLTKLTRHIALREAAMLNAAEHPFGRANDGSAESNLRSAGFVARLDERDIP